jgi:hypothetical protein
VGNKTGLDFSVQELPGCFGAIEAVSEYGLAEERRGHQARAGKCRQSRESSATDNGRESVRHVEALQGAAGKASCVVSAMWGKGNTRRAVDNRPKLGFYQHFRRLARALVA